MRDLSLSHLDSLEAQARLLLAGIEAMRHHVQSLQPPSVVTMELPERCAGINPERCAQQNPDGPIKNFGGPGTCRGCREQVA